MTNMLLEATEAVAEAGTESMSTGASIIYYAVQLLPMVLIFVVFYFLLIRPQRKKDKEAADMLKALKIGDRVCTIGGFYGTIVRIKDDVLTLELGAAKTQVQVARWAIKNLDTSTVENDAEKLI